MEIVAEITRWDLVRFNLYFLPRIRSNLIFYGIVVLLLFVIFVTSTPPERSLNWPMAVLVSLSGGVMALAVCFVVSLIWIFLGLRQNSGCLGEHYFKLTERGFHESTEFNETLHKWAGIQSVSKSNRFIFVRISNFLFHIIPRRAFGTEAEFEEFWTKLNLNWKQAEKI